MISIFGRRVAVSVYINPILYILLKYHTVELFAQKSPLIVSQNIINTLVGYAGLFFITRFLSPDIFGFLAFVMGFGGVFSFIADMGFSAAHQKHISEGGDIGTSNGTYLAVKIVLGFVYVGVVLGALFIWTSVLHKGFENPVEFWMILAITPYYFFQSLLRFAQAYFTAKLSPARMAIPSIVEALVRNSIFIALGLVFYLKLSISGQIHAAIILAITYSISYSIYFILGVLLGRPWVISRPTSSMLKSYAAIAIPLAISGSLSVVNGNVDKVIIQYYWHAVATGAFYLDQKIVQSMSALSAAITVFFLPLLSRISKAHQAEEFSSSISQFERMTSLFVLPFIVMFIALNRFIVNLFNGAYVEYSEILAVLALNVYFNVTLAPYASALTARNRTKVIAWVSAISVTLNIVLNLILVPPIIFGVSFLSLGVIGAAVSSLTATIINNVFFRYIVLKQEGARASAGILKQLVPVGVEFLAIFVMLQFLEPYSILLLAPVAVVSLLIYLGVSILIKEISFKQVWTFATYLSPIAILKQLREER